MSKAKLRLGIIAALTVICVSAALPSQASALDANYSCFYKAPASYCDGKANGTYAGLHSWDWNEGWTAFVTTICEHVWRPSTGSEIGSSCAISTWTGHWYGYQSCACYEAEVIHFFSGPTNVYGYTTTDL